MGVIIGIVGLVGLIALLSSNMSSGDPPSGGAVVTRSLKAAHRLPAIAPASRPLALTAAGAPSAKVRVAQLDLEWKGEPIRVAACAMLRHGIAAPSSMALGIAHAVYPDGDWPPTAASSTAAKRLWGDLIDYAERVVRRPYAHCTEAELG